jgi:hypothetical protein
MATFSLSATTQGIGGVVAALNGANPVTQEQIASYQANGFILGSSPEASGNALPFTQITPQVQGQITRNIITWFVPEFGTVQMFVNPQNITYNHKKLINKDRTKGGYTLQYWGEDLDSLQISGTTGSSGIEGINALYEIYRAEQYAFDAVGLTMAANNASTDVANNLSVGIGGAIGQIIGGTSLTSGLGGTGILGGILGLDQPGVALSPQNIPSLASLAFAVEMYYNGWVYRGFFENMTITERADNFLIDYSMTFTATQRRGYRTNYFPWSESPVFGASQYTTPNSFNGQTVVNTNLGVDLTGTENESLGDLILNTLL